MITEKIVITLSERVGLCDGDLISLSGRKRFRRWLGIPTLYRVVAIAGDGREFTVEEVSIWEWILSILRRGVDRLQTSAQMWLWLAQRIIVREWARVRNAIRYW